MKRLLAGLALALLIVTPVMARTNASIELGPTQDLQFGGEVDFTVDPLATKQADIYSLWVANKCSQDGIIVSAQYLPVRWDGRDGIAGPFTLGSWAGGAAECRAYVWLFPKSETPIRGAIVSYTVDS